MADQKLGCNPLISPKYIFFSAAGLTDRCPILTHSQPRHTSPAALQGLCGSGWLHGAMQAASSPPHAPSAAAAASDISEGFALQRLHKHPSSSLLELLGCVRAEGNRGNVALGGTTPHWVPPSLSRTSLVLFAYCLKGKWLSEAIISFTHLLSQRSL